jgi:hypothetical protein
LTEAQFAALRVDLLDEPLDPKLRYLWNADGTAQLQQTVQQLPASLRRKPDYRRVLRTRRDQPSRQCGHPGKRRPAAWA